MVDIVTMPTCPVPTDATLSLVEFATDLQGPLGGPTQRILRLGDRFAAELTYGPMVYDDARPFLARLIRASGSPLAVAFPQRGFHPVYPGALVVDASTPNAGGALKVKGGTPDFLLLEGQFFHIASGGRRWVHQIQEDTALDDAGAATLPINPLLRVQTATGDALEFVYPVIEGFRDVGSVKWTIEMVRRVGLKFNVVEDR